MKKIKNVLGLMLISLMPIFAKGQVGLLQKDSSVAILTTNQYRLYVAPSGTEIRLRAWNASYGIRMVTWPQLSNWTGSTQLTTLGTVGTGVWQGTPITDTYISSSATWNAKQNAISGTGYGKWSGSTISFVSSIPDGDIVSANIWNAKQNQLNGTGLVNANGTLITYVLPTISGDATGTMSGINTPLTLNTVNSNVGSFGSSTSIPTITVNGKGLITAASGNAVIAPAGTLTGTTLASNIVTSSLTSVGTIATGVWQGTAIADAYIASATTWNAKLNGSVVSAIPNGRIMVGSGTTTINSYSGFSYTSGTSTFNTSNANIVGKAILGIYETSYGDYVDLITHPASAAGGFYRLYAVNGSMYLNSSSNRLFMSSGGAIAGATTMGSTLGVTGLTTATGGITIPSITTKYIKTDGTGLFTGVSSIPFSDITGTVGVGQGGTGVTSLSTGLVMFGGTTVGTNPNFFFDNTNTRLSIGAGSANYPLHITNSGSTLMGLTRTSVGTFTTDIKPNVTASVADYVLEAQQASSGFSFIPHDVSNVAQVGVNIDRNSYVGLNTVSPTHRLHVDGDIRIDKGMALRFYRADGTTQAFNMFAGSSNNFFNGLAGGMIFGSADYISFDATNTHRFRNGAGTTTYGMFSTLGNFALGSGATPIAATLAVAQPTTGIGTVSNSASGTTVTGVGTDFQNTFKVGDNITVNGETVAISAIASATSMTTATITGANSGIAYTLTGGTRMVVRGNGNVGVGTATPIYLLQLSTTGSLPNFGLTRNGVGTFTHAVSAAITNSAADYVIEGQQASSGILLRTRNSSNSTVNAAAFDRDGNLGIGTLSPGYKADINGTLRTTQLNVTGTGTVAYGTSAGTSPTTGTNFYVGSNGVRISFTVGSSPVTGAEVFRYTYPVAYATGSIMVCSGVNENGRVLEPLLTYASDATKTVVSITTGQAPTASQQYTLQCIIIGN